MVDVLCSNAKELALCLALGDYSIIMDNGLTRAAGTVIKVLEAEEKIGDMF